MSGFSPMVLALAVCLAAPLAAQEQSQIQVEIAVGRSVVDRMPVDTASAFPADVGRVAAWTRVTGAAGDTLQYVWIHGENEFPVSLAIGGPSWRTWTTKEIPPDWTGEWRIEVRDSAGNVLVSKRFTVGS